MRSRTKARTWDRLRARLGAVVVAFARFVHHARLLMLTASVAATRPVAMSIPESQLENLVARCLDAGETGYRAELERLCAVHPDAVGELRQRIAKLEELGFLGDKRSSAGTHWLPEQVGGYRLSGLLGRGGMGVVFRGKKDGGDEVAIKIVRPDLLADERARERFRREALLAARLSHPGICSVLEVGLDDDVPYLVMPLLRGRTFGAWVREQRPARDRILELLEGHARALHAAHEAGLVHRDVTPGNLFVTDEGRAVVLDFGLARDTTGEIATLTLSQEQLGTLPYMAPEQIRGGRIDRRTDVYALGVVIYEALAGRLPFVARGRSDVSRLILSGDAPRLTKVTSGVARPLERIVQTAMDLDPARRYATALELAEDLSRWRAGQSVSAHGVGPVLRARRWAAHHPVATTAMSLLALLLGVATASVMQLQALLQRQQASEQALASRMLEQADPMRAIQEAIEAHEKYPSPKTQGQLNRLLHQVSMLASAPVMSGPVRRMAVHRLDDRFDLLAVAAESGVSLWHLDRRSGAFSTPRSLAVPPGNLLRCVRFSADGRFVAGGGTVQRAFVAAVGDTSFGPALRGSKGEIFDVEVDNAGNVFGADVKGRVLYWAAGGDAEAPEELCSFVAKPPWPGHDTRIRGMKSGPGGDLLLWNAEYAVRLRRDHTVVWATEPVGKGHDDHIAVIDEARERVVLVQLGTLRVVRWSDGEVVWQPTLRSPATECAVARDGTVASLHRDGTVCFWDGGEQPVAQYRDPHDQIGGVLAATGADSFLAVGRGGTQMRLDARGNVQRTMAGGDVERWGLPGPFQWSSDGSVLIAGGGPGRVRSWDFDGSRAAPQWRFVSSPPVGLSPHPDGRRLIVYTQDREAWLWDQQSEPLPLGGVPLTYRARNGAMPGDRIVIGGLTNDGPGVAIFDVERGAFRTSVVMLGQHSIVGAAVVPGERLLLAAGDLRWKESEIHLCARAGAEVASAMAKVATWVVPKSTGLLTCMDAAADGRRFAFGCVGGGMHVWGLSADGKQQHAIDSASTNGRVWSIDMSADGRFVVAGIQDGSVLTWAVDEGDPQFLVRPRGRAARAFLADNDHLVLEFAPDGLVKLWDTQQRPAAVVFEVAGGDGAVVKDAVLMRSPDAGAGGPAADGLAAMQLATVTSDGWVRIWSLDERAVVAKARARRAALEALAPR